METIHGQHLEIIDPSGRLLGRILHGYQLELFDHVFFFCFVFFNRFHHEVAELISPSLSTLNSFASSFCYRSRRKVPTRTSL